MPLSCVQKSRSYWRRTRYSRPLQPRWSQGSTKAPTSSFPRNTVGYIQSGTCVFWTGPLSSSRSRCWRRDASSCVRPFDWVAAIDLKDAYFHVSILPRFRFAYKGASIPVGPPLRAPQPVGASGQPGKEQILPYAEDLFSRQGVGLGQPHSTSLRGACSVNAEMPGVSPAQEGGSTETFSEAPGAYGILSRYHAARIASYETASALASRPSPEMGMAPRHVPGLTHPVLPSHLQPMVGPCFLRAGVP